MRRIEYPARGSADFTTLTDEYQRIFTDAEKLTMGTEWEAWKKREKLELVFPETVEDLLTADVDVLADVYQRFRSLRRRFPLKKKNFKGKMARNPKFKQLDKIFKYTNKYDDRIAKFFIDHATQLRISSCYYCETAYINVYHDKKRQFDVDHFLPKDKCPMLGLSLFNFVPSCQVCNSRIKLDREVGRSKAEYEGFNPAGGHYAFESNVRIHLRLNKVFARDMNNPDAYYIYFRCGRGFRKVVDFFQLTERYEFHKLEALRIKKLKAQYPKSARKKIANLLGITEAKVKEDLFHEQFLQNNNRCFAKLTRDML
jgi:hypothetical protein